jgi:hypothetical protein
MPLTGGSPTLKHLWTQTWPNWSGRTNAPLSLPLSPLSHTRDGDSITCASDGPPWSPPAAALTVHVPNYSPLDAAQSYPTRFGPRDLNRSISTLPRS